MFRPDLNMQRMNNSALGSGLPTFDGMELIKCIGRLVQVDQEWVPHGEGSSLYIRPTLIGIDVSISVTSHTLHCMLSEKVSVCFYHSENKTYVCEKSSGIKQCLFHVICDHDFHCDTFQL